MAISTCKSVSAQADEGVHVDIIDALPTPFGLVRSGVAPDHHDTKVLWHTPLALVRTHILSIRQHTPQCIPNNPVMQPLAMTLATTHKTCSVQPTMV